MTQMNKKLVKMKNKKYITFTYGTNGRLQGKGTNKRTFKESFARIDKYLGRRGILKRLNKYLNT